MRRPQRDRHLTHTFQLGILDFKRGNVGFDAFADQSLNRVQDDVAHLAYYVRVVRLRAFQPGDDVFSSYPKQTSWRSQEKARSIPSFQGLPIRSRHGEYKPSHVADDKALKLLPKRTGNKPLRFIDGQRWQLDRATRDDIGYS